MERIEINIRLVKKRMMDQALNEVSMKYQGKRPSYLYRIERDKKKVRHENCTFFNTLPRELLDELSMFIDPALRYILSFIDIFSERKTYKTKPKERRVIDQAIENRSMKLFEWALNNKLGIIDDISILYAHAVYFHTKDRNVHKMFKTLKGDVSFKDWKAEAVNYRDIMRHILAIYSVEDQKDDLPFLLKHAIKLGIVNSLRPGYYRVILEERNEGDRLVLLRYLKSRRIAFPYDFVNDVAKQGDVEALNFVLESQPILSGWHLSSCTVRDSVECVKILIKKGVRVTSEFMCEAIEKGALKCLEYVFSQPELNCSLPPNSTIDDIILDVIPRESEESDDESDSSFSEASSFSDEVFLFLIDHGYLPNADVLDECGQLVIDLPTDRLIQFIDHYPTNESLLFTAWKRATKTKNEKLLKHIQILIERDESEIQSEPYEA